MGNSVTVDRGGKWLGDRINSANLEESQRIWSLISPDYTPIDWHLDFKSGYRWEERTWYLDIRYAQKPGVDIKVPWELARMQHLPMLSWAYVLANHGVDGFASPEKYIQEFRNQILDFIATNPPRFGVNWACTMDVGIRAANWLIGYDLFRAFGVTFDSEFLKIFQRSIHEHGQHCLKNLEYSPKFRTNHYLSDIAGLLFVAAYLPSTPEIDGWLAFAIQELLSEMEYQFHPDGSNFEASTSYHRLSTEIMLYCSAICFTFPKAKKDNLFQSRLVNLPRLKPNHEQEYNPSSSEFFPPWFWERLEKAAEFTMLITKPTGEIPQIGDNDSGRFLKTWPAYTKKTMEQALHMYQDLTSFSIPPSEQIYWDENSLDHTHLTGFAGIVFGRSDFLATLKEETPELSLAKLWFQHRTVSSYHSRSDSVNAQKNYPLKSPLLFKGGQGDFKKTRMDNSAIPIASGKTVQSDHSLEEWIHLLSTQYSNPLVSTFQPPETTPRLTRKLHTIVFPDFGLYLYRSPRLYLAVRCGSVGQYGNGGHAHNDQLSIELNIDGQDLIKDPGTYLYTPLPEQRNIFRSTSAHFTLKMEGKEQNNWLPGKIGLFHLKDQAQAECLLFNLDGFVGKHIGFGQPVWRVILVQKDYIKIMDFGKDIFCEKAKFYSNGYGRKIILENH
ncbi:MAG: alginate lyase family protein [SAR324 cluster bacterium]|nr:alginate lyase family protein [SAR324 cluster bacterium]